MKPGESGRILVVDDQTTVAEAAQAFTDLESGRNARGVIVFRE